MGARRPRDRRDRIIAAASDLFRERGYHNVSMADVAVAVDIGPSALYRHFRNKNDLLYHVVARGLDSLDETVNSAIELDSLIANMAGSVADRRGLPVLWQREVRHLDTLQREQFRRRLNSIAATVAALVRGDRPGLSKSDAELLGFSILAVFSSLSVHRVSLTRSRTESLLADLAHAVAECRLGTGDSSEPLRGNGIELSESRRDQMLAEAIQLFDTRGFQSVNIDDIGAASGTSGANVYNYFDSKTDLLATAITRGFDRRDLYARQAVARARGPQDALQRLVRAQIAFGLEDSHLIGLMSSEVAQLPENLRRACTRRQSDFVGLWVRALDEARPGLDAATARIMTSAALVVIANAARTGRLRRRSDLAERVTEIAMTMLVGSVRAATAATT